MAERGRTNLPFNDVLINLSRSDIILPSKRDIKVPLVISKVQINFTTIIKDEHLSVSNRRRSATSE